MKKLTPVLMVKDVQEGIDFYTKNLGFQLVVTVPSESGGIQFAILVNDEIEIMLQEQKNMISEYPVLDDKSIGGTFTLYMDLGDVNELYEKYKALNIKIAIDMHKTFYGTNEFAIFDNNGYIIVLTKR